MVIKDEGFRLAGPLLARWAEKKLLAANINTCRGQHLGAVLSVLPALSQLLPASYHCLTALPHDPRNEGGPQLQLDVVPDVLISTQDLLVQQQRRKASVKDDRKSDITEGKVRAGSNSRVSVV
jgi:hypothetical protein